MTLDYSFCLRPQFTKLVFEKLLKDQSINLFSEKGTGRSKLIEDISILAHQSGITTLKFNMKEFQFNYRGFLKNIELQIASSTPGKELIITKNEVAINDNLPAISGLISHHRFQIQKQLLIIFDDFDALLGDSGHQFPKDFFNDLNSLKNTSNVTLCCVSEQSHKSSNIYYDGGKNHSSSWLELNPINIPRLKRIEIKEGLSKMLKGNKQWEEEPNKERIITKVEDENKPWYYMQILQEDYSYYDPLNLKKRLKRCKRTYEKRYPKKKVWSNWSWKKFKKEIKDLLQIYKKGKETIDP